MEALKQASSFFQEKYKVARMVFTDVTPAELLAEEVTSNDPGGPDAMTMTRIAVASFKVDDYWRIVDVLHGRFYSVDWKQWRQSYKALVLLEFLLTHGPEEFAEEFKCDVDVIEELGTFRYTDEKGFDWGLNMQKRSKKILDLLTGGETLREARLKALKITKEIQGFGNSLLDSPSSSSSSNSPRTTLNYPNESNKIDKLLSEKKKAQIYLKGGTEDNEDGQNLSSSLRSEELEGLSEWDDSTSEETGSLLDPEGGENGKSNGFISGICSKLASLSPSKKYSGEKMVLRSFSDVGRVNAKKKFDRQYSLRY
ncbi:hypothetical protein SLA2020_485330 [Shorea laevis]